MHSGGVRNDLEAESGLLTYGDLFAVHPFGNVLVALGLTGEQLRMRLNGVPIEPRTVYRVTINDFIASGGNGFSVPGKGLEPKRGILDVAALEQYVSEHSPLGAPGDGPGHPSPLMAPAGAKSVITC